MPMSLFKNNKNRNKVVNPYCSLGWLLIITIFQKCAKLKPPWVHLGKQINYYVKINFYYAISELEQNKQNNTIIFFLLLIFLTKKWTSAVCGGVRAHPSHPPPLPTGLVCGDQATERFLSVGDANNPRGAGPIRSRKCLAA